MTHVLAPALARSDRTVCAMAAGNWLLHTSYLDACKASAAASAATAAAPTAGARRRSAGAAPQQQEKQQQGEERLVGALPRAEGYELSASSDYSKLDNGESKWGGG